MYMCNGVDISIIYTPTNLKDILSNYTNGVYFLKINTDKGNYIHQTEFKSSFVLVDVVV